MPSADSTPQSPAPAIIVDTHREPMAAGPFAPTWESLQQYRTPDWFRDAKFGIWAHWGPQCEPEAGDWYARRMYLPDQPQHQFHLEHYGHPSEFGFKDVIRAWKAEKWDPEKLVALYKRVGAQYFFAMANHHDNLDLWDSKHHAWNSVRLGPNKDLIAGWAEATRKHGLPFGVSIHASHPWTWYEPAQGADAEGPLAGVPYDGKLTAADGKEQWWEGLDPQELYAQNHPRSATENMSAMWAWDGGANLPDAAHCEKFYNRTIDLINRYQPDLVYFDDSVLPLWPFCDAGLKIAAHYYNLNAQAHGGEVQAVLFGKVLSEEQKKALTWDVERGASSGIEAHPWQTDTCIGDWHYNRAVYDRDGYKSAATVIHLLADIVSKNGNLLLSVPLRRDGSLDEKEEKVLEGIAAWMEVNRESIFGTRPWKVFGEGPAMEGAPSGSENFSEGKGKPFSAEDVRFTTKDGALYAIVLGVSMQTLKIASLGTREASVASVEQLGGTGKVVWKQEEGALRIEPPSVQPANDAGVVYKIILR